MNYKMKHKHSIAVVIPFFGKWPEWIDLFFYSCKKNPSIDFIFYTDCTFEKSIDRNLAFIPISFENYAKLVSEILDIKFSPTNAYKLCDLKPYYGFIHKDQLKKYDFYGFGDLDLLFGNIRSFYTEEVLSNYDVISTHDDRISGHLNLFRNNEANRRKAFSIPDWKQKLEAERMVTITENHLTRLYFPIFKSNVLIKKLLRRFIGREKVILINNYVNDIYKKTKSYKKRKLYFIEQYTTPLTYIYWIDGSLHDAQPDTWYYRDGVVTNDRDVGRNFIYIHFMNFKSPKYRKDKQIVWEGEFYDSTISDKVTSVRISKQGIEPLE